VLFADTAALIKLLLDEPHSDAVRRLFTQPDAELALCRLAWVEAISGLARRVRLNTADEVAVATARRELGRIWPRFAVIEVTDRVVRRAADHAEAFALRAYDAVQLAAAHQLAAAGDIDVTFVCFDRSLNKAAGILGLEAPFANVA